MRKKRSRKYTEKAQVINFEEARATRKKKRKKEKAKRERARERREEARRRVYEGVRYKAGNKGNKKLLIFFVILIIILVVTGINYGYKIRMQKKEHKRLIAEQQELKRKKKEALQMRGKVKGMDYVEVVARKRLHLIKPGEILYILPEEKEGKKN